jgi:hypothetical protein
VRHSEVNIRAIISMKNDLTNPGWDAYTAGQVAHSTDSLEPSMKCEPDIWIDGMTTNGGIRGIVRTLRPRRRGEGKSQERGEGEFHGGQNAKSARMNTCTQR